MKKRFIFTLLGIIIFFLGWDVSIAPAVEKLKLGTSTRGHPGLYLPPLAAEEKGFWRDHQLQVEWVPFNSATELHKSMAAGTVGTSISNPLVLILAKARGAPLKAIALLRRWGGFKVWVSAASPLTRPSDLKGAKVEVTSLGGTTHAYGRLVAEALGLEKEIKFIGLGTVPVGLAALKVGRVDATIKSDFTMIKLKENGEVRDLVDIAALVPKEWVDHVLAIREELLGQKEKVVQPLVKAMLQTTRFINTDRAWAIEKMKAVSGFSEAAASYIYNILDFSTTGRMEAKAFENMINFMARNAMISPSEVPPLEKIYTNEFLPGS